MRTEVVCIALSEEEEALKQVLLFLWRSTEDTTVTRCQNSMNVKHPETPLPGVPVFQVGHGIDIMAGCAIRPLHTHAILILDC